MTLLFFLAFWAQADSIKIYGTATEGSVVRGMYDSVTTRRIPVLCMTTSWVNPPQPRTAKKDLKVKSSNQNYVTKVSLGDNPADICLWHTTFFEVEYSYGPNVARVSVYPGLDIGLPELSELKKVRCVGDRCVGELTSGHVTPNLTFGISLPNKTQSLKIDFEN